MIRTRFLPAVSVLAIAGLIVPAAAVAQDAPAYLPEVGDEVVVYTHTFRPENFEEASTVVAEEFTAAMDELGQQRYTLWIRNPSTYELVAISVFAPGADVDEWQTYSGRLDVLKTLEPMRQEPMVVKRYEAYSVTSTDDVPGKATAQDAPAYLPEVGDEVVVYTHTFRPENFEEASTVVAEEFTAAMDELGQQRYTLWIRNPSTYELVAISVFAPGADVDEWQTYSGRLDVLKTLEPMRQEPMVVKRYEAYSVTSTDDVPGT